eukprot:14638487-Alexandrium_andersonii.AAC.1
MCIRDRNTARCAAVRVLLSRRPSPGIGAREPRALGAPPGAQLRTSLRAAKRVPTNPGDPTLNSSVASPVLTLSGDPRQK